MYSLLTSSHAATLLCCSVRAFYCHCKVERVFDHPVLALRTLREAHRIPGKLFLKMALGTGQATGPFAAPQPAALA